MTTPSIAAASSRRRPAGRAVASGILILLIVIIFLLPYLWIVSSSFKTQGTIFKDVSPLSWRTFIPTHATWQNFHVLFSDKGVGRAMVNSVMLAVAQVIATLVLCSSAAFALTRIGFRGAGLVFAAILVTFVVPMEALVVPLFRLSSDLHLQDRLVAVFLPWIASPFALFMLRQAFLELPRELDEAAMLDGAGYLRTFWSIILPNVRGTLLALGLVTFLFSWNSFLWPLIIEQSPSHTVIQVAVAQSTPPGQLPNWGVTFAGATVATIPLILLFLIAQRWFIRGVAMAGIK